jgi:hypothetical protein
VAVYERAEPATLRPGGGIWRHFIAISTYVPPTTTTLGILSNIFSQKFLSKIKYNPQNIKYNAFSTTISKQILYVKKWSGFSVIFTKP